MGIFSREQRGAQSDVIENVIGPSASLKGALRSDGGVRIDGVFEGTIEVGGNVVIGEGGRVVANISARNITVGGAVRGDIDGTGRLEILATGQVHGDICVGSVMIDEGGLFQGHSRMRGHEQRALPTPRDTDWHDEDVVDVQLEPARAHNPHEAAPTPPPTNSRRAHNTTHETTAEPARSGPAPDQSAPAQSAPAQSAPTRPTSTQSAPTHSAPAHSTPTRPTSAPSTPAHPAPAQSAPAQPSPDPYDFSDLDIEPIIPDAVIEDMNGGGARRTQGSNARSGRRR